MKITSTKITLIVIFFTIFLHSLKAQNGLVAYFPLNANGFDESDMGINGVLNNTSPTLGILDSINAALNFNGTNSFINCGIENRGIQDTISISSWIRTSSLQNGFIVTKYDYNIDRGFHFGINDGYLKLGGRNNSGNYTNTGNSSIQINDSLWHHVVAIIHGNTWEVWIDCQQDMVVNSNSNNPSLQSNEPLTIGNFFLDNDKFFNGDIDEVRIYNRKISSDEIEDLCKEQIILNNIIVQNTPSLDIFPNPTTGILYLKSEDLNVHSLKIFDLSGKQVLEYKSMLQQINLSSIPNGIYWLAAFDSSGNEIAQQKIIKIGS